MKRILLIIGIIIHSQMYAQVVPYNWETEAIYYAGEDIIGGARSVSLGGGFGTLGGDFSSANYNPAGIGMYQFNEFSISPSFHNNTTTSYFNKKNEDQKIGLGINNFGLVWSGLSNNKKWKRINIAIGWNQSANYNRSIYIDGYQNQSSLVNDLIETSNGLSPNELSIFAAPAWDTYLIDTLNSTTYKPNIIPNSNKRTIRTVQTSGYNGEFNFSLSSSYEDNIYIGATIGIPTINYHRFNTHTETEFEANPNTIIISQDYSDTVETTINEFTYKDELSVYGYGINLKLGVIARLNNNIKAGIALHSPSIYNMRRVFNTEVTTNFQDIDNLTSTYITDIFEYQMLSPWKTIISAGGNITKRVLLNMDYELIDYSFSEFIIKNYPEEENNINQNIKDTYTTTQNIRFGGEVRFSFISSRAGYAFFGSPYLSENKDYSKENFTYGLGITTGNFSLDGAYVLSKSKSEYEIYNSAISPIIETNHNFILTARFKY